jgi:DNA helicase-2/ATP-dependent DNA helicase PcrA
MLEGKLFPTRAQAALAAFRDLVEELRQATAREPVHSVLGLILERTGLKRIFESDASPESQSRLENLHELVNAAAEAAERGEGVPEFLDHAALVSDADQLDEDAQVSLLTLHNAKGLEFPVVFIAGLEEGLAPHSRSFDSEPMLEEERRLCYVGMTRAQRRLILTWARARRRFGGSSLQGSRPSRFLREIPSQLTQRLTMGTSIPQIELFAERHQVRESAARNTYTGKTYNSLDHIRQFFASWGQPLSAASAGDSGGAAEVPKPVTHKPRRAKGARVGSVVEHPRWGRGTVVRLEGEGDEAKLTVSFPGHGLKKIVQKYAGLKTEE